MAKKHSMPAVHGGEVNVTPLIDVVMCLIIFFMLVAKIGVTTGGEKMDLPEVIIGVKIEKLLGTMIVNVTDPNLVDDGTGKLVRARSNLPIEISADVEGNGKSKQVKLEVINSAGQKIDEPLTRVLTAAVKRNKEFSVTIRAQRELRFKDLQKVLLAVGKAGVTKINFAGAAKKVSGGPPAATAG